MKSYKVNNLKFKDMKDEIEDFRKGNLSGNKYT